jgi:hypothetical protein
MSSSSPDDLAIAFRSINRRLREATGDSGPEVTASAHAELRGHLEQAGRLLGTVGDPTAIADAISATRPDRWDDSVLDELRTIALESGRLLRHIATLTGND